MYSVIIKIKNGEITRQSFNTTALKDRSAQIKKWIAIRNSYKLDDEFRRFVDLENT